VGSEIGYCKCVLSNFIEATSKMIATTSNLEGNYVAINIASSGVKVNGQNGTVQQQPMQPDSMANGCNGAGRSPQDKVRNS